MPSPVYASVRALADELYRMSGSSALRGIILADDAYGDIIQTLVNQGLDEEETVGLQRDRAQTLARNLADWRAYRHELQPVSMRRSA